MVTIHCFDRVFTAVEAVVFDKDGTLANSEALLQQLGWRRVTLLAAQVPGVQAQLLASFGMASHVDPAGLLAVGTRQENEIAAATCLAALGRGWIESLAIAQDAFAHAAQEFTPKAKHTPLCEGVLDLVDRLAGSRTKLAILSSDTLEQIEEFVQFYDLGPYFAVRVGATPTLTKPNPALLLHTCALLETIPQRTLVIGDSRADTDMAQAAGAAGAIGVTWGWARSPTIPTADLIVSDPSLIQVE